MNTAPEYIIQTHGLGKSFGKVIALKNLNLNVAKHSIFGFLGPNGSGKTTTIKLLLGLIQPTTGTATVFGHDIVHDSVQIRQRVGYLAQDPRYYEDMTARQILRFTAGFFYLGPRDVLEQRIADTLELVGLADRADRIIKGFSGGERQRLGIAQAQINFPDLLILDEPAASLDPMGRHDVLEVMQRLRKHTTIFYSTHILADVQRVSDTVAILNKGQLIAQAPIGQLLRGSEASVWQLGVKGSHLEQVSAQIRNQPWVSTLNTVAQNGHTTWQITVTDDNRAENELLRLALADRDLTVTEFGRKTYALEEVFMSLVEGNNNGR